MNEVTQNDAVAVGGGDGRRGGGVGAQSSTPAVAARRAADAGSDSGGGVEWQMVTRGKVRAGGARRTTTKVRSSVMDEGDGSQQIAPSFEAVSTAARKRKAEDSVNDKLTAMAATITQLVMAQKQTAESQGVAGEQ
ncbi:hypothetical protein Q7P35_009057 [Cladosporium inversicolor]